MGVMMDLFKKGNYVDTPYNNFFEIKARDMDKNVIKMANFYKNIILVVNISPYDKNFEKEFNNLISLKTEFRDQPLEILAFPSSQLDNKELSDREMKEKLLLEEMVKNNLDKIRVFNRVYVNGPETSEVMKFCYRNSSLFMIREGLSMPLYKNFSKFLITKNGVVHSYYSPESDKEELEKNIKYLINQKMENIKIRDDFINFNKYY